MTPNKEAEEWEIEFDKLWYESYDGVRYDPSMHDIKAFIKSLLKEQANQIIEDIPTEEEGVFMRLLVQKLKDKYL